MDANSPKYTLELFPTSDDIEELYKVSLTGMYPLAGLNDGSHIFHRTDDNAGVDLWTARHQVVNGVSLLDLGVRARMSRVSKIRYERMGSEESSVGVHYWLAPRSSIWKNGVAQANSIGVIDKTYRGNLMGAVHAIDNKITSSSPAIEKGTRLFQVLAPDMGHISMIVLHPFSALSTLDQTSRGSGGFGSTG